MPNGMKMVSVLATVGALAMVIGGPAKAAPAAACPKAPAGEQRPWLNKAYSPQCRARLVLDSFKTLDEKLDVLISAPQGGPGRTPRWMTDRGLPGVGGSDGPAGIVGGGVAVTAFPSPLSVAASFDVATASLYGRTMGREVFEFGNNRMGGPALDMTRSWKFGRSTESFGEDPYLVGAIAGAHIQAIQSQNVVAMAKHFAVYTSEQYRSGDHPLRATPAVDNVLSERAIREIYLPGFEQAVKVGKVGAIMCAFPRVNGTYACENAHLLGILKGEWGFDGSVGPDFPDAQRSIVKAVNAGLDSGSFVGVPFNPAAPAPGGFGISTDNSYNGEDLRVAVKEGKVSLARIDDLILRRLTAQFRIGTFDNPAKRVAPDVSTPERRAIVTDIVTRGSVLLKNDKGLLPLGPNVKSIAIIGDQAGPNAVVTELGSAYVAPMHLTPVFPAVRDRAGSTAKVSYARGTLGLGRLPLVPTNMVRSDTGAAGFKTEYFANGNLDFSGTPFFSRQEAAVEITAMPRLEHQPANRMWSTRWTGLFTPMEDGVQKFTLSGSGTARLIIDGKMVGEWRNADFADTAYANVPMKAGKPVEIRVEYTPRISLTDQAVDIYGTSLGINVRLGWSGPDSLIADAAAAAAKADVAVVFVGHKVGEGMDRVSLSLPNDQDALIEAVAAANPNTIVVLQTGGGVTMPWLNKVAAVLEMWLPGDGFGPAAAQMLFGDAEPAGRLPVTFPKDETQGPATQQRQYPGELSATGAVDTAHFDEGLDIGYRYWDAHDQTPLFPFGYGLSYTTFKIRGLSARPTSDGGAAITVAVRNTGARAGSEVVQAYVGFPAKVGEPPKQLKGMQKVRLNPGEERQVQIKLEPDAFRYWNEAANRWSVEPGSYAIMVGGSSRDIAYTTKIAVRGR